MNTYFVYIRGDDENKPEMRTYYNYGEALEPPEPVWCAEVITADTPARAKYAFLTGNASSWRSSPWDYPDDWPHTRVRLLGHGEISENEAWARIHEILDHGGKPCDCPPLEEFCGKIEAHPPHEHDLGLYCHGAAELASTSYWHPNDPRSPYAMAREESL